MNENAIRDAYELAVKNGYLDNINDFKALISSNSKALDDAYELVVKEGYTDNIDDFKTLMGVSSIEPLLKKKDDSQSLEADQASNPIQNLPITGSVAPEIAQSDTSASPLVQSLPGSPSPNALDEQQGPNAPAPTPAPEVSPAPETTPTTEAPKPFVEPTTPEVPTVAPATTAPTTPETLEVKPQPAIAPTESRKKSEQTVGSHIISLLGEGAGDVMKDVAYIPNTLLDVLSMPINFLAYSTGIVQPTSGDQFLKSLGIQNKVADYFKNETEKIHQVNEEYSKEHYGSTSIQESIDKGNYSSAALLMGESLLKTAPLMASMAASGMAMTAEKLAGGMTAAFYEDKKAEVESRNFNVPEVQKQLMALSMSATQALMMGLGQGPIGSIYKKMLNTEGAEAGTVAFKGTISDAYRHAFEKIGAPVGMAVYGSDMAANKVLDNLVMGDDTFNGVGDAFWQGATLGVAEGLPINIKQANNITKVIFDKNTSKNEVVAVLKDGGHDNIAIFDTPVGSDVTMSQMKIANIPYARDFLVKSLKAKVADGSMKIEDAQQQQYNFDKTNQISNSITSFDIPEQSKLEVVNLLKKRDEIQSKIDGAGQYKDVVAAKYKDEIDALTNQALNIVVNTTAKYSVDGKAVTKDIAKKAIEAIPKDATPEDINKLNIEINNNPELETLLKNKLDAVQKPSTDEGVLGAKKPEVELQGVGEGNAKPKGPTEGTQEAVTNEKPKEVTPELTEQQREIKRDKLNDEVLRAKKNIDRADDTETAIEEYNTAKKVLNDFDVAEEQRKDKIRAEINVANIIEDEINYSQRAGYEYKDLYKRDPRLAAIESTRDLIKFTESGDVEAFHMEQGLSQEEAKAKVEESIKRDQQNITDLEADIQVNPIVSSKTPVEAQAEVAPAEAPKVEPTPKEVEQYVPMSETEITHDKFTKDNAVDYEEDYKTGDNGREYTYISRMSVEALNGDGDTIGNLVRLKDEDGITTWNAEDINGNEIGRNDFDTKAEALKALADRWNKGQKKEFDAEIKRQAKADEKAAAKEAKAKEKEAAKQPKETPKEVADEVHNDLLAHLGIKEAPVSEAKPVKKYTAKNIDTISEEGLTDTQKKVVSDVKNVVKSVSKLVEKTSGTPLEVNIHESPASYEKAVLDAGGTKQESTSKGFYLASDGTIHLNMDRVTTDTMLHEGFHPVLDYMADHRSEIIDKLHDQLKGLVGGKDIIESAQRAYKGFDEITIRKEAITDYIAKVADGTIKIDKTNFQKVKDFIVNAINKLGFDIGKDINNVSDIKKLAELISEKFNKGEEIKGKKTVIENKPQFSKGDIESKVKDFIEIQRAKGISEKDIKSGLEKASQQIGLDKAKINELMSPVKEKIKAEQKVEKQPEEGMGISEKALAERDFVEKFDQRSDQEVGFNTMERLQISATKSGRSVQDQAAYEVANMKIKNGESSEHQIMTAAYHLHNLDAQIEKVNNAGEDASFLVSQREDALSKLRQLGNNAGRNLRLFAQAYKVTEEGKLEIIRAGLRRDLGVDKIPNTIHELNSIYRDKTSDADKAEKKMLKPFVEEIQKVQKTLKEIKVETEKTLKESTDNGIKEAAIKADKSIPLTTKGPKPSNAILDRIASGLKDMANKLKGPSSNAQFSKTEQTKNIDVQKNTADAILYVANKIKSGHIPDLVDAAVTKFSGEGLTEKELKTKLHDALTSFGLDKEFLEAKTSREIALENAKELAKIEDSKTITPDVVSRGIVNDIFNDYARKGVPYDELIKKTTADLKESFPSITESEVSDAVLGRGKFKKETKQELKSDEKIAKEDVRRLTNTENKIKALQVVSDIEQIKDDITLSAKEKKAAIEERKSEYEKSQDDKLKQLLKEKAQYEKGPQVSKALARVLEEIEYIKTEKTIYKKALAEPRKADADLTAAKETLKNEYNKLGIRKESGSKTEIQIAQETEDAIQYIKDQNYSEEVEKEHIKAEKDRERLLLQNTKQGVLTNLKDALDNHISDLRDMAKEALDKGEPIDKINKLKDDLKKLSDRLNPNEENLKDQIDKADRDLNSIVRENEKTDFGKDLKNIEKEFHNDWQRTSNELQAKELVTKARRSVKEAERRIAGNQFTEIPTTKIDAETNAALAKETAAQRRAWSKLSSLAAEAREQRMSSGFTAKVLEGRRDFMIASFPALYKVFGSSITKPFLDTFAKQTFGQAARLFTGIRPTELKRLGMTFKQLPNKEAAENYMKKMNDKYVKSIEEFEKAKGTDGEKQALKKVLSAEIDQNASLAYLFINAGSHIDIEQIMVKGATDLDAALGKYKQSFSEQRTKLQEVKFWLEAVNRTHAAMKSFSHRQSLIDNYIENLQMIQDQHGNITPETRMEAWNEAVIKAEEGRFGEKTWASDVIGNLKNSENAAVRNAANYAFPVAKIGINIAKQGLDMAAPGELAYRVYSLGKAGMQKNALAGKEYSSSWGKVTDGIKTAFNDLSINQKKRINTLITRGLFGAAQYALIGYMLSQGSIKFGGSYDENDKFGKNRVMGSDGEPLEYGQWEINGHRTPKLLSTIINHSPYFLPAQIQVAFWQQLNSSKEKEATFVKSIAKVTNEVYEKLPITGILGTTKAIMSGDEYKLEHILANEVPSAKNVAEFLDKDAQGNPIKRDVKAEGFWNTTGNIVKSNIPGKYGRESLPEKVDQNENPTPKQEKQNERSDLQLKVLTKLIQKESNYKVKQALMEKRDNLEKTDEQIAAELPARKRQIKEDEEELSNLLGKYLNQTELKRYKPETWEKNFGVNSPYYKKHKYELKAEEKLRSTITDVMDKQNNYTPVKRKRSR